MNDTVELDHGRNTTAAREAGAASVVQEYDTDRKADGMMDMLKMNWNLIK